MPKRKAQAGKFNVTGQEVKLRVHTRLPDDHPFYALVGRVASEWSRLEHILDQTIYDLANSRVKGSVLPANVLACITSQIMGVGPRCKAIISLAMHCGLSEATVLKPFRTLMSNSYETADHRARIVHDPWYVDIDSKMPAQFRAMSYNKKKMPQYGFSDITKEEVEKTIIAIQELQHQAAVLRSTVLAELAASARKRS